MFFLVLIMKIMFVLNRSRHTGQTEQCPGDASRSQSEGFVNVYIIIIIIIFIFFCPSVIKYCRVCMSYWERIMFSNTSERQVFDSICFVLFYSYSKVDLRSQEAYELAALGLLGPEGKSAPILTGLRCIDFQPPNFTLGKDKPWAALFKKQNKTKHLFIYSPAPPVCQQRCSA